MAREARSQHTVIRLQDRLNPCMRRAAQLLSSGKIGRPLSARVVCPTVGSREARILSVGSNAGLPTEWPVPSNEPTHECPNVGRDE